MDTRYQYKIELLVRDYECDLQGVVNNANYQHYLEHARHEFMYSAGIDFAKLHDEGTDLIVSRVELDYKFPLRSRDRFVVCINAHREGRLRFVLEQDIYLLPDEKLVLAGKVIAVALKNGRPVVVEEVVQALERHKSGVSQV